MWMIKNVSKGRQTIMVGKYALRLAERRETLAVGCECKDAKAAMLSQRGSDTRSEWRVGRRD